jgi:transcriptional regulator with XRE-family HTH domain
VSEGSGAAETEPFARLLRELRTRSGLSYGTLAKRLHVSTSTLHRYCNGTALPHEYMSAERFARVCRATPEELVEEDQRDLLTAIGIEEAPELVAAEAAAETKPKVSRADRFQLGLAALTAFVERDGHAKVPRPHNEGGTVLGAWLNNRTARRDRLSEEQRGQLEALGVAW